MNDSRRFFTFAGILALLLTLVLAPPVLTGYAHLSQAESLQSTNLEQAAREYESAARLLIWRADLWEKAGMTALADGNPELAIRLLERSLSLSSPGRLALGDSLYRLGDIQSGLEIWETLRNDSVVAAQVHNRLGHVYYLQSRYDDAIESFSIAAGLDDYDSDSRYMLGLLKAAHSPENALDPLIRAAQLDPKLDPVIQVLRSGLSAALLSSDKATQLTGAGRTLVSVGAWTLAKEAFENAIAAEPHYAPAWAWLGKAKQVLQEGGLLELDHALSLDPNAAEIRGLRAVYFMREDRYEEARSEFEAAAGLDPLNPGWQVALGDAVARTGDVPQALEHYQRAIELSPRSFVYWRALADFTVDYNYGVQETGLPAALQARALGEDPQNEVTLGRIYFALGDYKTAEKIWSDLLESNLEIPSVHLYLGVLFLQQGNYDSAGQHFAQAVVLDPGGPFGAQAASMMEQFFP